MFKPSFDKETKVWSGPNVPPIYNPNQNLGQLIVRVLEQTPDAVTQISADTGVSVTCGEMRERILKIAAHLSALGLKQGDVVGVVAANTEHLAPAVFACFLLGLPVNPLAPMMIESDITQMYMKTKPKLIFCDGNNVEVVQNAVNSMQSGVKIFTISEKVNGYGSVVEIILSTVQKKTIIYPDVDPNSAALILCSSGSTGFPKGVIKTHINAIVEFNSVSSHMAHGQNVLLQSSAIFWFSGSYQMIMGTLYSYVRIITTQSLSPESLVNLISTFKVTEIFTPPFTAIGLLQMEGLEPFPGLKSWFIGGTMIQKGLCERIKRFIPNGKVIAGYGLSEQGLVTIDIDEARLGSLGTVSQNVCLKIVDDDGCALNNNHYGEIYSKAMTKFLGYFGEPEKTEEVCDGEWFKTGDIGCADDDGFVNIVGRKKELLKYSGFHVTPSELEAVVNEIEGVVSSYVVGVMEETGNDILHAFVIVDETKGLTDDFVLNYFNGRVIDPKRLRGGVHFVETLPVGLTGKVDRLKVRRMAEELQDAAKKVHNFTPLA
jgi:4-coumarate--CoA ligase